MSSRSSSHSALALVLAFMLADVPSAAAYDAPLFDAHLHYNATHVETVPPDAVGSALQAAGVERAVIISRHPDLVEAAMRAAPGRILPFLDVYRSAPQKDTWMHETDLPDWTRKRLDEGLETGAWRGIGELHLFADDRHSPVFEALVRIADERGLPLMIHGDPAVIDRAFEIAPQLRILWAHAGTVPYPPLIRDYLQRYPNLHADLSMRSERLNGDGFMPLEWQDLLVEHADRFLVGADTFSAGRWTEFDRHVREIRSWLEQLPSDVADRIARGNARLLFRD